MKIVIFDAELTDLGDVSWDAFSEFGDVKKYPRHDDVERCIADAEVVLFNSLEMPKELIDTAPELKYLGIMATGYDAMDVGYARSRGIACTNVPGYSTEAVAQHAIALLLEVTNRVGIHHDSVRNGEWTPEAGDCYWKIPMTLLAGKSIGIFGYGKIGSQVAKVAEAFGMDVNIYSRDQDAAIRSDIISLHMPANPDTEGIISREVISSMKDGAILINTARGALVDEEAVLAALDSGKLSAYATDVLATEPPAEGEKLIVHPKCIVTPHNAWGPVETRQKLIDMTVENLRSWSEGGRLNRVD